MHGISGRSKKLKNSKYYEHVYAKNDKYANAINFPVFVNLAIKVYSRLTRVCMNMCKSLFTKHIIQEWPKIMKNTLSRLRLRSFDSGDRAI